MGVSDSGGRRERAGGIIETVADSFRGAPLCFAAVLLAAMFAGLTYYGNQQQADRQEARFNQLLGLCWNNAEMPNNRAH